MNINSAIIGMGVGQKHFEALENYRGSKVKIICEKDKKKLKKLKKKYPNKLITSDENKIFSDKKINLVSIASYDNFHYSQILKSINTNKNIIVEKPMCLNFKQLQKIYFSLKKNKKIKITSNLVLRTNSLFLNFKKKINRKKIFYIEADYIWGRIHKLFGWRSKISGYSITLGAAIHMIDLVMWILKLRPLSVQAFGNNIGTKKTIFKKKSMTVYIFKFPMNILVKVSANAASTHDHFHELKIFQKNLTLVNSNLGSYSYSNKKMKIKFEKINSTYPDRKNRKKLIHNFIDTLINKKTKPIISLKEQIDLMTVCFAADKALKLKQKVNIKYLD
tara:strand:- start:148 stop:1146 length:999 start_codon:yes stop_codon:yes gene_type:complete